MGCGFITFGKSLFTILKTVVPKQFGCKNTKPSTQAREFVYIKLPHLLENLSIQLASKIQVTSYIFLQKWENQTFYIFSTYKNTAPVAGGNILKTKGWGLGIILPKPCFDVNLLKIKDIALL